MSADIRYAGGAAQHIQIPPVRRTPANLIEERPNRTTQRQARILDTLRRQHPAWRYTGLDNSSYADKAVTHERT
jgi:hypothetical protein